MKKIVRYAAIGLLTTTIAACSSSNNDATQPVDDQTVDMSTDTDTNTDTSTDTDTDTNTDTGSADTSTGATGLGNPPELNSLAEPVPGPDANDPFGSELEIDSEAAVAGGPPTTPKNLRAELVSNDWAEINWAPSNDDGEVVEYKIYRSDGHIYTIGRDQTDANGGTQNEIDKFWRTTSFIDCNYTRFLDRLHECGTNGPKAGDTFSYTVSAIDDEANESAVSEPITITYHAESNAPVPLYEDFYKEETDKFASVNDLSKVENFFGSFTKVFSDEFNGTAIDETKWNTELTWTDETIINGEQQYFVNTQDDDFGYDPFKFSGTSLLIEAIQTPEALKANLPESCDAPDPTGNERCLFLSGALSSHDLFGMTYGYVESRMKVGGESGMLSSFYLYHRYPGDWHHAPEIDIIEYLGENPFGDEDAFQTYHYGNVTDKSVMSAPTMQYKNPTGELYSDEFHTFSVLWEPQLVVWYIDGVEVKRLSGPQVGRQHMNIVAYLVAGSAWAPTPDANADNFPLTLEIDYIRAYQRDTYNGNGLYPAQ